MWLMREKQKLGVGLGWDSLVAAFLQDPKLIAQSVAVAQVHIMVITVSSEMCYCWLIVLVMCLDFGDSMFAKCVCDMTLFIYK